ncbi:phage tail tip fiber protein [Aeromonas media]|uniref:phage tail tip fiber protein n=1 Tax=Aeromonas media TaxID=651 RepID=UPI003CFD9AB7
MAKKPAYRAGRDQAATAENVELLTGQRGDRLDKAVTFRELAALGLSTLRPGAGGVYVPGKNPELFPPGQMEFPHAPVNVIANGAFHTVLVEWDPPQYRGHAHAEIWRAESDNQAEATLVGTSSANLFSDAIGKGAKFYYWVRFVNGKDDKGPFQGVQGVEAETSRDVQDILHELQGKIEESHLAQALLGPIEQVPQLQLDIAILKPKVDEIEVIRPKVAAIEDKIPSIEQELAGLDERQRAAQDLLDDAQQQLGMSSIEIGLVQDRLNAKLDKYKGDFDSFRDAVFVVDPENGSITMDAVNAVRDELHTSITEVHQQIDAVAGEISSKADNVTVDGQGSRITEAEQRINGLDASLSQTVTRGEFTGEQQRVTQIGQELDATKGELTQKATKQEVDVQGVRLANAESKLTVHTDELSSQAQRLDGLAAQVTQGDETLQASITELARVSAESDQVTAQRVSGLEVRAGTSEAKIQALEEIIEDDGGITAGRLDAITAELELQRGQDDDNASAAIDGALAVDERDRETRKAFGAIRTEQRVILTEQQAQAQRTTDMEVKFEAKDAATQARISSIEKVTSDAGSALAQRIDNVTTEFKAADAQANADIRSLAQSSAAADEALSLRQDQLAATLSSATAELAANITQEESARVTADEAISMRVAEVEAQFSSDLDEVNARVAAEESARANQDEALAQQISTVDAAFKAADTALSASLSESSKALADADRALGERISTLDVTVGENSASITELQQAVVSNEESLSQRQDKMESEIGIGAVSQVEGALALDERDRENRKARGVILQQQSTLANQQEAQARTVEQLTAEFDAKNAEIRAQITNEQLTRATADEALSQRISVVDSEFKAADAATNAAVAAEVRSRSDADSALAEQLSTLDAEFKGAEQELAASIDEVSRVSAEANQALSEQLSQVKATAESAGAAAFGAQESADQAKLDAAEAAGIANGKGKVIIQPVAPGASDQLAQNLWIDTSNSLNTPKRWGGSGWIAVTDKAAIDAAQAAAAAQEAADRANHGVAQNSAAINEESKARADADSAMAQQIQQVTANYQQGDQQLAGQITAESAARADAVQSLGSQINTVSAVAGSKNKTFFQATAPSTGMGTGDLWFDTANNNRPYRHSGTAWIATDDPRIAANAASIQTQSQAIANLQNGAQAMWTAKASAGQITAGIGLVAKSDGTSQVAISASQVFVFNPNSSTPMAPLFAIDNGQAVIAEAIIRKATIQILTSEKITADYIKAGVSISAPSISGGSVDMGNAFLSGGAAGFGKGGPYASWGFGWYTMIYADGSIYTNRLRAEGGYVKNMTMNNCTIAADCVVLGTLEADRIVGDITRMIRASGNFSLAGYKRARNMVCIKPLTGMAEVSGSGTIGIILLCKLNGSEVARATSTASFPMGTNRAPMSVTFQDAFVIPAGTATVNITFEVVAYPGSSIQNQRLMGESLWLMGLW